MNNGEPIKIAFSGMKGSGKDYCLTILQKHYDCFSYSFSDQLKSIAHTMYPWMERDYPPELKEQPIFYNRHNDTWFSPRDVWTRLNALVEIDPMILVRGVEKEYYHHVKVFKQYVNVDHMIVKDLRPHNPEELAFCLCNGFKIILIENNKDPIEDTSDLHTSEQGYDSIKSFSSAIFKNNKTGDEEFIEFFDERIKQWKS